MPDSAVPEQLSWRPEAEIPLYRQLKDIFLACIEGGQWLPGELIPTEAELAATYGVSKGPIRQALGQLVREGLLDRRQGRGTWVLPRPVEWSTLSGIGMAGTIERHGRPHTIEVRQFALASAAPSIAAGLARPPGAPVYLIELCRYAGDDPVGLETLYVPQELLPQLRREMLGGREMIYTLLKAAGHHNTHSHESVQAVVLDRYEAAALNTHQGAPALLVTNRAFGRTDIVLVYSFVLLRGNAFRISIALPPRAHTEVVRTELVAAESSIE